MRLFEGLALERNLRPTHRLEYLRHRGKGEGKGICEDNQTNEVRESFFDALHYTRKHRHTPCGCECNVKSIMAYQTVNLISPCRSHVIIHIARMRSDRLLFHGCSKSTFDREKSARDIRTLAMYSLPSFSSNMFGGVTELCKALRYRRYFE